VNCCHTGVNKSSDWTRAVDNIIVRLTESRKARFGHKVGQIGPKWDKSRTFSLSQNKLKSDLKKVPDLSRLGPI